MPPAPCRIKAQVEPKNPRELVGTFKVYEICYSPCFSLNYNIAVPFFQRARRRSYSRFSLTDENNTCFERMLEEAAMPAFARLDAGGFQ